MLMSSVVNEYRKRIAWALLVVLVVSPVACSITLNHLSLHTCLGKGPCVIEGLISSIQKTVPSYLVLFVSLLMWLLAVVYIGEGSLKIQLKARAPGWLKLYNLDFLPRNYILLALKQGILHSRVY